MNLLIVLGLAITMAAIAHRILGECHPERPQWIDWALLIAATLLVIAAVTT